MGLTLIAKKEAMTAEMVRKRVEFIAVLLYRKTF
jgi:hypothetical protein